MNLFLLDRKERITMDGSGFYKCAKWFYFAIKMLFDMLELIKIIELKGAKLSANKPFRMVNVFPSIIQKNKD